MSRILLGALGALFCTAALAADELPDWDLNAICAKDADKHSCVGAEFKARNVVSNQWLVAKPAMKSECLSSLKDEADRNYRKLGACVTDKLVAEAAAKKLADEAAAKKAAEEAAAKKAAADKAAAEKIAAEKAAAEKKAAEEAAAKKAAEEAAAKAAAEAAAKKAADEAAAAKAAAEAAKPAETPAAPPKQ